jgi:type II secretory pathway pseudopilin PulG
MTTVPDLSTDSVADHAPTPAAPASAVAVSVAPRHVWPVGDLLLVAIVGLLAVAAGFVTLQNQRHDAARDRVTKNFTAGAAAFRAYIEQNGSAPATANTGEVPAGMAEFFGALDWSSPSPVGGAFRWVASAETKTAPADSTPSIRGGTITLTAFSPSTPLTLSTEDLLLIDRQIDDGNLSTGNFRTGFNGWPVLSVQVLP